MESVSSKVKAVLTEIKSRRLRLGYSQEYVAIKLGMTQKNYSKIELGICKLRVDHVLAICELFHVPVEELVAEKKEKEAA